jgi:Tfp pilus assembly protein PilX
MPRLAQRSGFTIPMAMLVALVLLVMLTAAFTLVSTERRITDDTRAATDAEAIAESGLERYMVGRLQMGFNGIPGASESTRVVFSHGYADVVLTRIKPPVGLALGLYIIKSHGVRTVKKVANSVDAERTVAEYAQWKSGTIGTSAAWTSLSGLHKNGGSGTLSGVDQCGGPSVAGVAVPHSPGYTRMAARQFRQGIRRSRTWARRPRPRLPPRSTGTPSRAAPRSHRTIRSRPRAGRASLIRTFTRSSW